MDALTFNSLVAQGEVQSVEFKGDQGFTGDFRAHLASAMIAFANTSGGGTILIGIDKAKYTVIGVSPDYLSSFDPTTISHYVKERSSLIPRFNVERYAHANGTVIIIQVQEFDDVPIIVTKDITDSKGKSFAKAGDILIRSRSCECRRINTFEETQDLVSRAVMRRSEQLLNQMRIILSGEKPALPQISPEEQFNKLLPDYENKASDLIERIGKSACWKLQLVPIPIPPTPMEMHHIPELIRRSAVRWRGWTFPQDFEGIHHGVYFQNYAQVESRIELVFSHDEFWQMSPFGAFGAVIGMWQDLMPQQPQFNYPPPPNRLISLNDVCWTITEYYRFATNLIEKINSENIWIRIALCNIDQRIIGEYDKLFFITERKQSHQSQIQLEGIFSQAELQSSWQQKAHAWIKSIYTVFQYPEVSDSFIESMQQKLQSRTY